MNEERAARLQKKYGASSQSGQKKEMTLVNRGRGISAQGKPKNTRGTVVRLMKYLGREKKLILLALCMVVLYTVSSLAASYLLRPIINKFIYFDPSEADLGSRIAGLAAALLGLAAVYAVAVATQWLQQRIMLSVSQRSLCRMRKELFDKLQTLPIRYFDNHPTGDVMSRFTNDVDAVGEMLNTTLVQIFSGILTLAGTVFLMLYTNVILGMMTILMTPLLVFATKQLVKRGRRAYTAQQKRLGVLNGFAQEIITGQKVVKVFNHEDVAMDEFSYLNHELMETQIKAQFQSSVMGPVTHQLCNVGYALTACVGAILVVTRGFDLGGLTVSINYTRQFNRPINEISMQMNNVFSALAGAERVFEVLDQEPEREETETVSLDKITGHIVLDHVNFGYTPDRTVLHDISLYAKPGQKIAFVGSTGAGKTTVTNLLSRFYDIQSGSITIDGVPIERIPRDFLRQNIAMVLQDTHLFTGTVRENIRYGRLDATDEEVIEAAKRANIHEYILSMEHGYDTQIGERGVRLSGGQKQRLSIARVFLKNPPILILDEATSALDNTTEMLIQKSLDELCKGRTTIVVAHRLSTIKNADEIAVIADGTIVEHGSHKSLLAQNGLYATLYHEQFNTESI